MRKPIFPINDVNPPIVEPLNRPLDARLGQPVPPVVVQPDVRVQTFARPARRWPGLLAVGVLGAGLAALAVSSFYDPRSVGEKVDATVDAAAQTVRSGVDDLKLNASTAARDGAQAGANAGDRVAEAINDAGITASVKTALAADPRLSAVKIDVDTKHGVVSLVGPAPDDRSRERATVLASAPPGVQRVDNRLVVSPPAEPIMR